MSRPLEIEYRRPLLYPKQSECFFGPERYAVTEASTKSGKAQPLTSAVQTPTGACPMGGLRLGDEVLTPDGASPIIGVYPQGEQDIYRVTFSDGRSVECTADHLWEVWADKRDYRRGFYHRLQGNPGMRRRKDRRPYPRVMSTRELMTRSLRTLRRLGVPIAVAHYAIQDVPLLIDPYVLGLLLGDGGFTVDTLRYTSADTETLAAIAKVAIPVQHGRYDFTLTSGLLGSRPNPLIQALRILGLWGLYSSGKFIPPSYLLASVEERMGILQGLLDSDGWVDKRGQPHLEQTSKRLAEDVRTLVESLGGFCYLHEKNGTYRVAGEPQYRMAKRVYRLTIVHPDAPSLFRLPRKTEMAKVKIKPTLRKFRSIERVGRAMAQCIELADPRGVYLTDHLIPTHNTVGAMAWLVEGAWLEGKPGRNYWWGAPILPQARIAYRRTRDGLTPKTFVANDTESTIKLPNGATIWFKGMDNPDSVFGEDVYRGVIDEASRCKEESWHAFRTTLTATRGPIRIIGNVKGKHNWFYRLARRAEAGEPDMTYHRITWRDAVAAGVLEEDEIRAAKRDLPEAVFRELYEAEASDDQGNPFGVQKIAACVAPLSERKPAVWGWDLAKSVDYTVGIALDREGTVCQFHRWQAPWEETEERIMQETQGIAALVDATGVGDPVVERLQRSGMYRFEGFKFTSASKQELMFDLRTAIQKGSIRFPDGPIRLELESFEYTYTRTGVLYSSPEGAYDDCVMALAMAWRHYNAKRIMPEVRRNTGQPVGTLGYW